MGTEKTGAATMKSNQQHRNKPPPVPPRPQHLIPVKIMSKYSSMPDILNGWKRDTNPDLVKMGGGMYSKRSIVDVIRPDCVKSKMHSNAYPPMHTASNEYLAVAEKTYRDVRSKGNNYTMLPIRGAKAGAGGVPAAVDKASNWSNGDGGFNSGLNYQQPHVNGKSSKKFSCIPSRSNSKKKQQQQKSNEHVDGTYRYGGKSTNCSANGSSGQISQTSWYVEDIQLSKCEINVNNATTTTTMAAVDTSTPPPTTATIVPNYDRYATPGGVVDRRLFTCSNNNNNYDSGNGGTKGNGNDVSQQRTYRKQRYHHHHQQQQPQQSPLPQALPRTIMSSPSLSSLPPLPKSLSDASLLWETTNKKISGGYPVSRSPARSSSSSSSSRGSSRNGGVVRHIIHPKVPPPAVPRSNSISSCGDDQPKISAVYVNSLSIGGARAAGADGDAIILRDERPPPPPPPRKPTSLDMKLSILRKEMNALRQMDLSLLSQLWSLNESIHEFRQKQELLSPNSPYLNSSDEEDSGCYHSNISSQCIVTANNHNTLGSSSSRSSISTGGRSTRRDSTKP